jgi:hypothetical protein
MSMQNKICWLWNNPNLVKGFFKHRNQSFFVCNQRLVFSSLLWTFTETLIARLQWTTWPIWNILIPIFFMVKNLLNTSGVHYIVEKRNNWSINFLLLPSLLCAALIHSLCTWGSDMCPFFLTFYTYTIFFCFIMKVFAFTKDIVKSVTCVAAIFFICI